MTTSDPLDLAPIRARLEATTPGPWYMLDDDLRTPAEGRAWHVWAKVAHDWGETWPMVVDNTCDQTSWADAEFIAAAPSDIAALIAEVERLRGELTAEPTEAEVTWASMAIWDHDKSQSMELARRLAAIALRAARQARR